MAEDERDRFTRWYDRQSWDTLVIVGLLPMVLVAVTLIVVAVIHG